jgi:hypothetical protein
VLRRRRSRSCVVSDVRFVVSTYLVERLTICVRFGLRTRLFVHLARRAETELGNRLKRLDMAQELRPKLKPASLETSQQQVATFNQIFQV